MTDNAPSRTRSPSSPWVRIAYLVTRHASSQQVGDSQAEAGESGSRAAAATTDSGENRDDFEAFEDQQRSFALLDEHSVSLARDARQILDQHRNALPVGLVLEADAAEAAPLLRHATPGSQDEIAGFIGVVPRELVLEMLRRHAPHALDFLEPDDPHSTRRRLPLIAIMRTGYRLGAIGYEPDN